MATPGKISTQKDGGKNSSKGIGLLGLGELF